MAAVQANKILVVEDDSTVRGYLATILTDDGFSVTTRSSGKAAKALLKKEPFDLVLTDLIMPEVNGLDLLKFIRKQKVNSEVIILTAFSDMDSVLDALREGADDFLVKPVDRLVLHKAVTRAFKKVNLEREKKKSDEKYHKLFESTTDMVLMLDSKGVVTEMNLRGIEIFGRTSGQIVGKPYKRLIHKEDYDGAVEALEKTINGGTVQFVARIRPKDESLLYFEFDFSPLFSDGKIQGVYCIAHDITELKQLQNRLEEYSHNLEKIVEERTMELKASEERLRALTTTAQDGVITVNSAGKITFANRSAGRILECSHESLIQEEISNFIPPEIQDSKKDPLAVFFDQDKETPEGITAEIMARNKTGVEFHAEVSVSSFTIKDDVFVTILLRDITSRAEDQERILGRQKMESIGRLAGGIAHNLNNILCGLLGYASFLKTTAEQKSELYRYLDIMEDSCEKAARLVRQILEYAEGGKYHVELCSPNKFIEETVAFLKRSLPGNIAVEFNAKPSVQNVMCDPSQIKQVLLNLAINAREAMGKGGKLMFSTANIKVDGKTQKKHSELKPGEYVAIEIIDTGDGIDRETMTRMFDPFYSTKGFGCGMGLSSSLGIVKKHNGTFDVVSTHGQGTTFTIYLPATDKKLTKRTPVKRKKIHSGTETILVVDDEKVFAELAQDILERSGYTVMKAETGKDGIRLFKNHRKEIDLVLMDMVLPDMKGEDVLNTMREIDPETRFAITSGYSLRDVGEELLANIDGAFLKKPCTAERMTEVVRTALNKKS